MGTWSAAVAMVVVYIDDPLVDWPAYAWWLGIVAVAAWPLLAHCRPTGSAGGSPKESPQSIEDQATGAADAQEKGMCKQSGSTHRP